MEYRDLGSFSDRVKASYDRHTLHEPAAPGRETQAKVRHALGFSARTESAQEVLVECQWEKDGLIGEEVSWWVGYGPRTHAIILKPADADRPLPGILALHSHDSFKFFGKEKIADGPNAPPPDVITVRDRNYGGRAFANELAREGYVVLAHDGFLWGSRKFSHDDMPEQTRRLGEATRGMQPRDKISDEVASYNAAARHHEDVIEKYCRLLGTTLAGVVSFEDRVAVEYLRSRPDVTVGSIGCIGFSGGGCRAVLLQATSAHISAAVTIAMMSTYEGLLDHNVAGHSWLLSPTVGLVMGTGPIWRHAVRHRRSWPNTIATIVISPWPVCGRLTRASVTTTGTPVVLMRTRASSSTVPTGSIWRCRRRPSPGYGNG